MGDSTWRRAGGGLLGSSGLLPGNRAILVRIEKDARNTDAAFTSAPNFLAAVADSSVISSGQGKYGDD